ncbi:recombination protein RecR [Salinisphaera sp. USBA-960]|uniref:recombination mediator RecR n=1 Tax=Salinisphaera orenii TaxID=856731 RepID=UPI000DBE0426|nr:recombination protein RecR [Salifodinibacter halophilus]NNC26182.1 recombination protein RecR [Salifodinibacter halophilus]
MGAGFSPKIERLIGAFRTLPGVGQKSAQRMAFNLLAEDRNGGRQLAEALTDAMDSVGHCDNCRMLTERETCTICDNANRDQSRVCVVESPADVVAIETNTGFDGRYFVLGGRLSPIDGVGPDELGLELLRDQISSGVVAELIMATSATVEGQTTSEYVADLAAGAGVAITRIAQGVPVGGDLETVDAGTLNQAFAGRSAIQR